MYQDQGEGKKRRAEATLHRLKARLKGGIASGVA